MARFKQNDLSEVTDLLAVAMLKGQFLTTSIQYNTWSAYYGDSEKLTVELVSTDREELKKFLRVLSGSI
jgi:hypothetical protein